MRVDTIPGGGMNCRYCDSACGPGERNCRTCGAPRNAGSLIMPEVSNDTPGRMPSYRAVATCVVAVNIASLAAHVLVDEVRWTESSAERWVFVSAIVLFAAALASIRQGVLRVGTRLIVSGILYLGIRYFTDVIVGL